MHFHTYESEGEGNREKIKSETTTLNMRYIVRYY